MNETENKWQVGQIAWLASGTLDGREWDIDAEWRATKAEAQADAAAWRSWLSDDEKRNASTRVDKYEITDITEGGEISARSI